jgi:uncharacterized Zn finger protein (UPF0148 family)
VESIEISMKNGLIFCPFCDATNESKPDFAEHIEEVHNRKIQYRYHRFIDKENGVIGAVILKL